MSTLYKASSAPPLYLSTFRSNHTTEFPFSRAPTPPSKGLATIWKEIGEIDGLWECFCNTRTPSVDEYRYLLNQLRKAADSSERLVTLLTPSTNLPSLLDRVHNIALSRFTKSQQTCGQEIFIESQPLLEILNDHPHPIQSSLSETALCQFSTYVQSYMPCLPRSLLEIAPKITKIIVTDSNLLCLPGFIGACTKLHTIDIRNNLVSTLPETLLTLPKLQFLAVLANPLLSDARSCEILKNLESKGITLIR